MTLLLYSFMLVASAVGLVLMVEYFVCVCFSFFFVPVIIMPKMLHIFSQLHFASILIIYSKFYPVRNVLSSHLLPTPPLLHELFTQVGFDDSNLVYFNSCFLFSSTFKQFLLRSTTWDRACALTTSMTACWQKS